MALASGSPSIRIVFVPYPRSHGQEHRTSTSVAACFGRRFRRGRKASTPFRSDSTIGMLIQKMTLAEFLDWESSQPERFEFRRGQVIRMDDISARHNRVAMNLAGRIGQHLDGTACQVFATGMKVQAEESVLYPDVLVTCGKATAGDEQLVHGPKLLIETGRRTMGTTDTIGSTCIARLCRCRSTR